MAIVTGASRGIGAAITAALTQRGATVVALGSAAAELRETAKQAGAEAYVADVRDPTHAEAVVRHTIDKYGRVDIVIANAGIGHIGDFVAMDPGRIDDLVSVNTRAPMLLAHAALPGMLDQGSGAIVLLSSIAGAVVVPRETVYSASKAAIEAFAEALGEELRGSGITVSTVVPTVVNTKFFEDRGEPYDRAFPRPISPERLALIVVRMLERGKTREVVPRWAVVPMRMRGVAPRAYRALSRRFM